MEALATWLGHLWYYPYYSTGSYLIIAIFLRGFAWYFLCILLSYIACKDLLDYYFPPHFLKSYSNNFYDKFYKFLATLGVFGLFWICGELLFVTFTNHSFSFLVNINAQPYLDYSQVLIAIASLFCLFEFIEHRKHRTSLLKDILTGYLNPFFAIIIISLILGLYMETQNFPLNLWVYINWPLENVRIFGTPVLVLLSWPIHYIFFLSFYRAFDNTAARSIWSEIKIK